LFEFEGTSVCPHSYSSWCGKEPRLLSPGLGFPMFLVVSHGWFRHTLYLEKWWQLHSGRATQSTQSESTGQSIRLAKGICGLALISQRDG